LGEEGFGKVVLVKKKASYESNKSFAIKMMKKSFIISCSYVSFTIIEKEAPILTSGHPFITTLYSCFQTKVIFKF
jgi:serine/threonine protein kinase